MASISVDVEISHFPDREVAFYVAENDDLWAKCLRAREAALQRRSVSDEDAELRKALRDGLIREAAGAR